MSVRLEVGCDVQDLPSHLGLCVIVNGLLVSDDPQLDRKGRHKARSSRLSFIGNFPYRPYGLGQDRDLVLDHGHPLGERGDLLPHDRLRLDQRSHYRHLSVRDRHD